MKRNCGKENEADGKGAIEREEEKKSGIYPFLRQKLMLPSPMFVQSRNQTKYKLSMGEKKISLNIKTVRGRSFFGSSQDFVFVSFRGLTFKNNIKESLRSHIIMLLINHKQQK